MPGSNGKRKFKIERRRRMTSEQTLSTLMNLCRRHGINVVNAQDLPEVFNVVLDRMSSEGQELELETPPDNEIAMIADEQYQIEVGEEEQQGGDSEADDNGVALLTESIDLGLSDVEPEEVFLAPDAPNIGWEIEAKDVLASPRRSPVQQKASPPPVAAPRAAPKVVAKATAKPQVDPEMIAEAKAKQAQVMQRVAQNGVQYRNSPGPSQGRKIAPHPSVADKVRQQLAKPKAPAVQAAAEDEEDSSGPNDGFVNPKTGLSLQEQREIVARVTGKVPKAPKAGALNMLKS